MPRPLEHPPRVIQKGAPAVTQLGQGGVEVHDHLVVSKVGREELTVGTLLAHLQLVATPLDHPPQLSFHRGLVANVDVAVSRLRSKKIQNSSGTEKGSQSGFGYQNAVDQGRFCHVKF